MYVCNKSTIPIIINSNNKLKNSRFYNAHNAYLDFIIFIYLLIKHYFTHFSEKTVRKTSIDQDKWIVQFNLIK